MKNMFKCILGDGVVESVVCAAVVCADVATRGTWCNDIICIIHDVTTYLFNIARNKYKTFSDNFFTLMYY